MIKTYEKFFSFLKKKKQSKLDNIDFLDIYGCLYEIVDDDRIKIMGLQHDNGHASDYSCVDFLNTISPKMRDDLSFGVFLQRECAVHDPLIFVYNNILAFRIEYELFQQVGDSQIIRTGFYEELKEILLDVQSKLDIYDCRMTLYLSWQTGVNDYAINRKEYDIDELFGAMVKGRRYYDINIKILAPCNISNNGLTHQGNKNYRI